MVDRHREKNTLGTLLVQEFYKLGSKAILLDLDVYVEKLNPSWVWKNKQKEKIDAQNLFKLIQSTQDLLKLIV